MDAGNEANREIRIGTREPDLGDKKGLAPRYRFDFIDRNVKLTAKTTQKTSR